MKNFSNWAYRFWREESGVTSIEYALVGTLIALVITTALLSAGGSINAIFVKIAGCIANPRGAGQCA